MSRDDLIRAASTDALEEALKAAAAWPPFHSPHEGYGVILEEMDELWDEIKLKEPRADKLRQEAIQLAAMALRFAAELGNQ